MCDKTEEMIKNIQNVQKRMLDMHKVVLICGDRNWTDKTIIMKVLKQLKPIRVIEGGARGADTLAKECAEELNIPVREFPANWGMYGLGAGPKRNKEMLTYGKPEMVIAFHDEIEKSKGTRNMIIEASKKRVPIILLYNSKGECKNV